MIDVRKRLNKKLGEDMKNLINETETFLNNSCLEEEDYITEIYYILNKLKEAYDKINK